MQQAFPDSRCINTSGMLGVLSAVTLGCNSAYLQLSNSAVLYQTRLSAHHDFLAGELLLYQGGL